MLALMSDNIFLPWNTTHFKKSYHLEKQRFNLSYVAIVAHSRFFFEQAILSYVFSLIGFDPLLTVSQSSILICCPPPPHPLPK